MKDEEIYNIFNTEKLLNRPAKVAVDNNSGLAGIAHWLNRYLTDNGVDKKVDKKDPVIAAIKEKVDAEYERGRTTVISDGELEQYYFAALEALAQ